MSWDYAELSHMAKEAGGPDLLLSTMKANARSQGRIEGAGIGALVAGTVFTGATLLYRHYSKKKALANTAEAELANGIHAYEMTAEGADVEEPATKNTENGVHKKAENEKEGEEV